MGFVENLVLFAAVKEIYKSIKNNDKAATMVKVVPFFDHRVCTFRIALNNKTGKRATAA